MTYWHNCQVSEKKLETKMLDLWIFGSIFSSSSISRYLGKIWGFENNRPIGSQIWWKSSQILFRIYHMDLFSYKTMFDCDHSCHCSVQGAFVKIRTMSFSIVLIVSILSPLRENQKPRALIIQSRFNTVRHQQKSKLKL